jgi:hypothetical protein
MLPGGFVDEEFEQAALFGWWLGGELLAEPAGLLDGLDVLSSRLGAPMGWSSL